MHQTTLRAARPEPQRTCVGCRQRGDRSRLLRVVADRSGGPSVLLPDPGARLPGRGAWLHPEPACLDLAERRRAFPRALRLPGPIDAGAVREHLQQQAEPPHHEHSQSDRPTRTESGSSP
ncbi:YlxR family protein [Quadrisphaera setariae]|uniref:YlxR family protein n=1 Tax=Quadrisphaera setariae TaxID=2593304 RepID=A0A5C8ZE80_9ACTN|nr:YlxR family protein [Quadrisphaera setariae]